MKPGILLLTLLLALPAWGEVVLEVPDGEAALLENLRARLGLEAESCDAPEWRVRRLFESAENDMQPALRAFGYYRPSVSKQLTTGSECWRAVITIDLGRRTTVRKRSVEINGEARNDKQLQTLLAALPLPEGASLDHGRYEEIKRSLRNFAMERGYFDFELTRSELRIYPDEAAAEIDIVAQSGSRYRFGELQLNQQPLDEKYVRRLAAITVGDPYDARVLTAADRHLSDSGVYRRVLVRAQRDAARDGVVPIELQLQPAPRHAWQAGVGYATDTGPRVSFRYENRYLNPRGHRFETDLRLSPVESSLSADYTLPGRRPHREQFSIGARMLRERSNSVDSDSVSLIGKQTLKSPGWTQTRFIELLHERSVVGEDHVTSTLLMPGIGFSRIKADDPVRTQKGYRLNATLRAAHEGLLSTASLVQLRAHAKGIYRFGKGGRVTGRLEAGATLGAAIGDLPGSLRFFAGGDNSVRGYEYQSLSPLDAEGDPEGGRHLLTGTLEYEHPLHSDDWWLAAFVDAGNAFDSDDFDLKVGYGVGLRWFSPIGRLRVDLAFPQDREYDDWRIHFGLGADL